VVAVLVASRGTSRVRYRPRRLSPIDAAVAVASSLAPLGVVALGLGGDDTLRWTADPLALPAVDVVACMVVLLLLAPAVVPLADPGAPVGGPGPGDPVDGREPGT
jgi:hypothetical protein